MLENHRDVVATQHPQLSIIHVRNDFAGNLNGTLRRGPQPINHPDEGGLSGSRQSHNDEGLPLSDLKAHVDDSRGAERGEFFSRLPCLESFDYLSLIFTENLVQVGCSN